MSEEAAVRTEICNICGKEFRLWDGLHDIHIRRHLGYGSKYDGEDLDMRICCDCLDKIISICEVSPVTKHTEEV